MSEVSLCDLEQFLFRIACELRPALAERDSPVSVLGCRHVTSVQLRQLHLARPTERVVL